MLRRLPMRAPLQKCAHSGWSSFFDSRERPDNTTALVSLTQSEESGGFSGTIIGLSGCTNRGIDIKFGERIAGCRANGE